MRGRTVSGDGAAAYAVQYFVAADAGDFYAIVFILSIFVPESFLSVAFDSGGVTTGPMTVPFIMALGVGIAAIRSDRHAADDSFGLVALCSIGPILAVMLLGMIYRPTESSFQLTVVPEIADSIELWGMFAEGFPDYMKEIAVSLLPIILFFGVFQLVSLRISGRNLVKILIGLGYTYIGLVLFLTGVNVGFMPAGNFLGQQLAGSTVRWMLIPVAMVMGYFIVKAEPAVYVLNHQVEEIDRRCDLRSGDGNGAVDWCRGIVGTCNGAGVDGHFDHVVFGSRLYHCNWHFIFCSKDLYRNCF